MKCVWHISPEVCAFVVWLCDCWCWRHHSCRYTFKNGSGTELRLQTIQSSSGRTSHCMKWSQRKSVQKSSSLRKWRVSKSNPDEANHLHLFKGTKSGNGTPATVPDAHEGSIWHEDPRVSATPPPPHGHFTKNCGYSRRPNPGSSTTPPLSTTESDGCLKRRPPPRASDEPRVLRHPVEGPLLSDEVGGRVELCHLSFVQHQNPAGHKAAEFSSTGPEEKNRTRGEEPPAEAWWASGQTKNIRKPELLGNMWSVSVWEETS